MASVSILGTVNKEAKIFENESGSRSAVITVQESFKNKDDSYTNINYDCWFWGKPIEWLENYPKGKPIAVSGNLVDLRHWESQSSDATGTNIVVRNCELKFIPRDRTEDSANGPKKKSRTSAAESEIPEMDF